MAQPPLPAELQKPVKQINGHSLPLWPFFHIIITHSFSPHNLPNPHFPLAFRVSTTFAKWQQSLSTHNLPKPHYPLLCTITLASLVKGRWIDGKAQALILLLSACNMPTIFMLQTFLPSRRRDCLTSALCPTPTLPKPHYPSKSTITLAFKWTLCWLCVRAIVVVCGRCVLHRLFATTCKHPCLKPLGVQLRASMPALEKGEVARLIKFYGLLYSIQIVLPLWFWNYSEPWRWGLLPIRTIIEIFRTIPRKPPTPFP